MLELFVIISMAILCISTLAYMHYQLIFLLYNKDPWWLITLHIWLLVTIDSLIYLVMTGQLP